jgi:imidazoleglycerol-phosphate dehydratase
MTVVVRETKETTIRCELTRGTGQATVSTGQPFLDHMLVAFARYSGLDVAIQATGDLPHHLIEDVAICLGASVAGLLPATAARYGDRTVPMDEALIHCALDLGGRPYYRGPLPSSLYDHFMRSFSDNAKATLHLRVLRGTDRHHIVEGAFKALGFAVRDAFVDTGAVFSTKGSVALRVQEQ